jgi:S1-C subfamily serine protease
MRRAGLAGAVVGLILVVGCVGSPDDDAGPATSTSTSTSTASRPDGRDAREVTVRVRALGCRGLGTGSGVAISPSRLVTNRHVVEDAERLEISTWDGRTLVVRVLGVSRTDDIAVVDVEGRLPDVAKQHEARLPSGTRVVVAGFPEGGELAFRRGRVVDYVPGGPFEQPDEVMRSTAEVLPGNSGGPVFDAEGRVVAIVFGVERRTGHALAIPVDRLRVRTGPAPASGAC